MRCEKPDIPPYVRPGLREAATGFMVEDDRVGLALLLDWLPEMPKLLTRAGPGRVPECGEVQPWFRTQEARQF